MADNNIRRYYHRVYRLAQQAAEAFAFFGVIRTWFTTGEWGKDFGNAVVNEELFRIVASACKKTSIVTTHTLFDRGKTRSCNVFELINRVQISRPEKRVMQQRLKPIAGIIRKIGALRNHIEAHLVEHDEWRKEFGEGLQVSELNRALAAAFSVLIDCGKALGIRKLDYRAIHGASELYGKRLIQALSEQAAAGKTGRQLISVHAWEEDEEESRDESEPE